MNNFSGQDIVAQERCKIVYATFIDYIVRCFDSTKRIVYLYNPTWWNTTYDPVTKILSNEQFEVKGITFEDNTFNLPLISGTIDKSVTGIAVKLKAENYIKWRVYPVINLPICLGDQSFLYGLIPYNLFCSQFIAGTNFYLIKPLPIVSNLATTMIDGIKCLSFTMAPVTNFIDPEESITEPMDIVMRLIAFDTEYCTNFEIVTIESQQFIQVNEPIKYLEIASTEFYSEQLEGTKFYMYTCQDYLPGLGFDCISPITFYDQLSVNTLSKTALSINNLGFNYSPQIVGNSITLGDLTLKFVNFNNNVWETVDTMYMKILPLSATKFCLVIPESELILLKNAEGQIFIIDMSTKTYNCVYGDLTLTTIEGTFDEILAYYPVVRYPISYLSEELSFPTMNNSLHSQLMIRATDDEYSVDDYSIPLYWKKNLSKFEGETNLYPTYTMLNQKIVTAGNKFSIQGLVYDRLGTRPYEITYKYYKWDTIDKVFKPGDISEVSLTQKEYYITLKLLTNICKVKFEVFINGEFERILPSMLVEYPVCDFPRQYSLDICDCKPYYCVDLGDSMLMPCEILSSELTGQPLPFCMGWEGETKVPYKDVVISQCVEPQICTIYGCIDPYEFITPCTTAKTTITSIPACDWFGPGTAFRFNAPVIDYFLDYDGTIWCTAEVSVNSGTVKTVDWVIGNIYDYLTPNEYEDLEGRSYVVDPMYWIYAKYFATDPNITFPFMSVKMNLGTLTQIVPGIQNVQFDWSATTTMNLGSWSVTMQACKWMTISVTHTREISYVSYKMKGGVSNVKGLEDFTCPTLQTGYDAYCEKAKWLINDDAYAYAVYMGYLDPAVGIVVVP